jgi:hypothetical protein
LGGLRCPLALYAGEDTRAVNELLAARARRRDKHCDLVIVSGDHAAMVVPVVQNATAPFRAASGK